jgi:Zn-dependent M28 family amino/carboxypeptidase
MIWLAVAAGVVTALGFATWFVLTQPVSSRPGSAATTPAVDPKWLEGHVRALVAFAPRSFDYPENLDRAAAYVRGELGRAGGVVSEQTFVVDGDTYRNIGVALGPDTPERIVVGAHYDAVEEGPGADDNASGVAALIALSGLLAKEALRHRVELVAYSLEEPPNFATAAMGSAAHARRLKASGAKVIGMLCVESIGYFRDEPGSQRFPIPFLGTWYPDRGDFIAVVSRVQDMRLVRTVKRATLSATALPVHSLNAPQAIPGVSFSDHRSYWDCGYPAVMITDTAPYRNPHYHTDTDLPATLDYRRMALVVVGLRAAVLGLDAS